MKKKVKETENYVIAARDIKNPMRESLKAEAEERQLAALAGVKKHIKEINAEFAKLDAEMAAKEAEAPEENV